MLGKLAEVESRYQEIEGLMSDPEIAIDYERVAVLAKDRAGLHDLVDVFRRYQKQAQELDEAKDVLHSADDAEMRELAQMEVAELEQSNADMLDQLRQMLLPRDPRDSKNVIVEIRAGAGGDEAGIFVEGLPGFSEEPALLKYEFQYARSSFGIFTPERFEFSTSTLISLRRQGQGDSSPIERRIQEFAPFERFGADVQLFLEEPIQ